MSIFSTAWAHCIDTQVKEIPENSKKNEKQLTKFIEESEFLDLTLIKPLKFEQILEEKNYDLNDYVGQVEQKYDNFNVFVNQIETENDLLKHQLQRQRTKYIDAIKYLKRENKEFKQYIEKLYLKNDASRAESPKHFSNIANQDLENENEILKQELEKQVVNIKKLEAQLADAHLDVNLWKQEIKNQKQNVDRAVEVIENLQKQLGESQEEIKLQNDVINISIEKLEKIKLVESQKMSKKNEIVQEIGSDVESVGMIKYLEAQLELAQQEIKKQSGGDVRIIKNLQLQLAESQQEVVNKRREIKYLQTK
jgi:chromosome segregation ATPase